MKAHLSDDGTVDVLNITPAEAAELLDHLRYADVAQPGVVDFIRQLAELVESVPRSELDEKSVSVKSAARILGVSKEWVRQLCDREKLVHTRNDAGHLVIDGRSLALYVEARANGHTAA